MVAYLGCVKDLIFHSESEGLLSSVISYFATIECAAPHRYLVLATSLHIQVKFRAIFMTLHLHQAYYGEGNAGECQVL